jgi:hypothetical protein
MIDGVEWVDEPAATAMHFQRRSDSAARRGESQDAALFAIAAGIFSAAHRLDEIDARLTHIQNVLSRLDPSG